MSRLGFTYGKDLTAESNNYVNKSKITKNYCK